MSSVENFMLAPIRASYLSTGSVLDTIVVLPGTEMHTLEAYILGNPNVCGFAFFSILLSKADYYLQ